MQEALGPIASTLFEPEGEPLRWWIVLAVLGGVAIGVVGAIAGARASLRRATGPRQRALAVRSTWLWSTGVLLFTGLQFVLPKPWSTLLWLLYGPALTWGILKTNRAAETARLLDERERGTGPPGERVASDLN